MIEWESETIIEDPWDEIWKDEHRNENAND